jgi:hypothetical protein
VGALIASRRPRNPIGWILLADVVLWMLTGMMAYYGVYGVASPGSIPLPLIVAGIDNVMWVPAVGVLGTYVFLHFPDGRLPSRRWRPPAWLAGGVIALLCILVGLFPGALQNLGDVRNPFGLESYPWVETAGYFVLPLLPLCIIASVLIDFVISRTLVYGSLTISLVLVYVGSVVSLQYVFRALTGGGSQLVIVASTLVIAVLFNPLRGRIQRFIDRSFYRSKFDARETLEAFSARFRDETDLEALDAELLSVIRETMQPEHVSLWLRTADRQVKR